MRFRLNSFLRGEDGKGRENSENSRTVEALVLGATPELRTLIASIPGVRVTIIDCVLAMMQAMTALAGVDSLSEVWIRGDWRLGAGEPHSCRTLGTHRTFWPTILADVQVPARRRHRITFPLGERGARRLPL